MVLHGLWCDAQLLGGERAGSVEKCQQGGSMTRFEATPLGRAQALLGELEVGEVTEGLARPGEAGLEARSERTDGRGAAIRRPHDSQGSLEDLAALGRALGQAVGAHQRLGLPRPEPVTLHHAGHGLLLLGTERAQRVGQRHAKGALVDLSLQRLTKLLGQGEPHQDPTGPSATGPGDGLGAQLLFMPKRPDHPGLVHRTERAGWAVGFEQGTHPLGRRARRLHQDRHTLQAEPAPAREALEAVDELIGPVLGGHHA
jgi:hypothetical protein